MILKEREAQLKKMIDELTDEFSELTTLGIMPDHIICDAEKYSDLNDYFYFTQNNIIPFQGSHYLQARNIVILGVNLPVIQRIEKQFEGIHIYGIVTKE